MSGVEPSEPKKMRSAARAKGTAGSCQITLLYNCEPFYSQRKKGLSLYSSFLLSLALCPHSPRLCAGERRERPYWVWLA